jgi:hypothetical protein
LPYVTNGINVEKVRLSFIPNLIHSIDGYILREVVRGVFFECNYIINHVHDSFSIHPNFLTILNNIIYKIYQSSNSWLKIAFLYHNQKVLSSDTKEYKEYSNYLNEYELLTPLDIEKLKVKDMYPLE